MKVIKRNQIIILVMSLMLITAGYLNFVANNMEEARQMAEVGDARLVSVELSDEDEEDDEPEDPYNENRQELNEEAVAATAKDQYFIKSKLERDTMYSQLLETYQDIYNNVNSTAEQKNESMKEIARISNVRNSVMIAENLITAKGFEDLVIFANSNSISVIVKAEELTPEQIAQIQHIISRELSVSIETIHISTK